jgi:hypothetical protein
MSTRIAGKALAAALIAAGLQAAPAAAQEYPDRLVRFVVA